MKKKFYDLLINKFCLDDFCFENIRLEKPNGMFKTCYRDFDLIFFNSKRIVFFASLKEDVTETDAVVLLRASLNSLVDKLSLSLNKLIVCGANNNKVYFLNKYNDRLSVFDLRSDESLNFFECIENELSYATDEFDYDEIRYLSDVLSLSRSSKEPFKKNEKTKVSSDGSIYINKRGIWREASALDVETLFLLTVFGGMFGVHLFYQKKRAKGILYFITFGLFGIGWFFDSVELLLGTYKDSEGKYLIPIDNKWLGAALLVLGAIEFVLLGFLLMLLFKFVFEGSSEILLSLFMSFNR